MKQALAAPVLVSLLVSFPGAAFAQSPSPEVCSSATPGALVLPQPGDPRGLTFDQPKVLNPFTSIGHDLKTFFSPDSAKVLGIAGAVAALGFTQDNSWVVESQEHLAP